NVVLVRKAGGRLRDRRGAGRRVLVEGGPRDGRVIDERGLFIDLICGFAVEPVRPGRGDRGTRERSGRDQTENQREQGEQRQGASHEDVPVRAVVGLVPERKTEIPPLVLGVAQESGGDAGLGEDVVVHVVVVVAARCLLDHRTE